MTDKVLDYSGQLYLDLMKRSLTASIYDESGWSIIDTVEPVSKSPLQLLRSRVGTKLIEFLRRKSVVLVRRKASFNKEMREEGKDWPIFGYTMAGHRRLDNVQMCVEDVIANSVPGDFMETGVWRGGTVILMRALLKAFQINDRKVWAADSFEGLPVPKSKEDGSDLSKVDLLKVPLEKVQANFSKFDLLDDQVIFIKGWFCDTLPSCGVERLSILRLDGDLYSSTMDALVNLYDKVSPGGYVIVDDYYSWPSCHQAVNDFLNDRSLDPEIVRIDWTGAYWKVPKD